ncbi:spore germination protein [Neobacillus citreus]|uniref:Spore germination protein n=1 Tax=Neobacillus citreus TaxID=2833578 RepID=A0A942Y796_9BACI|nr:spore germination protein [Neobacillus citreus]MCH6265471.1 spore germination protein [Neobacillus citreus]
MGILKDGISIGTVSGGIVNFGGAVIISPISITNTVSGSGSGNTDPGGSGNTALTAASNLLQSIADNQGLLGSGNTRQSRAGSAGNRGKNMAANRRRGR